MQKLPSILLVDDDPTTNFLHEHLLLSLGVTDHCLVAENGADALDLLAKAGESPLPALVLLDVHMPIMSGIEFLEAYVQPLTPPPVIVVLSTSEHPRDQSLLAHLPVAGWVTKPLTHEKVRFLLAEYFQLELPPAPPDEDM